AQESLDHLLEMSNISLDRFQEAVNTAKHHARVGLHFHPDRLSSEGRAVAETLLSTGQYKNQFETGISAGSLSYQPGGPRYQWEERLFGGAYSKPDVKPEDRPKYGALDLLQAADGPAPRFGSCYFLLSSQVNERCTFTYRDSHLDPPEKGTIEDFEDILAALFTESFEREFALGYPGLKPGHLVDKFLSLKTPEPSGISRNLDHYIETQVHGRVDLLQDAEQLVADQSFHGHHVGHLLESLARKYDLALRWRTPFRLPVEDCPGDFRGAVMPDFARRVAGDSGVVDARLIGIAAASIHERPDQWKDFGDPEQLLQLIKRLWHTTVKYG
ncbi:MAG: DUF3626 domain-containing protein, partial [Vulcanimicrobiota bacterium]